MSQLEKVIKQVIPLKGYEAVFINPDTKEEETLPVFAFALVNNTDLNPETDEIIDQYDLIVPLLPNEFGWLEDCTDIKNYVELREIKSA